MRRCPTKRIERAVHEARPGVTETRARNHRRRSRSRLVRFAFNVAGALALGLGLVGIFLPLLPTTPFVLLAAACFARGSERFHQWLLANRTFGPMVFEWERHRSLPYRTKVTAIVLMSLTMAISIVFFVELLWLKIALALFGIALAVWMYRIPSRDHPARRSS